jgi:Ca-activated chloride channel family protein
MTFSDPRWLWLLIALPVLLALEWRAGRRRDRALERLVGERARHPLLAQRLPGQRRLGVLLRCAAFALLAFGAAGPEWGRELVRRQASGSDLVFLIDVSASMDVRDVAPSRLEETRREALAVLDHVQGSKVGVVAFAGDAVRLCPLTLDRGAARLVIEALSSSTVGEPGSDLGRGLRAAARMLPPRRRSEQAILLWTDGEDVEEEARGAIEELARGGIRVFAVGVGTPNGDVVPVLDDQGRAVDVKRDENGGPHRSRLDEALLRTVARRTRGTYFAAHRPGGELPRLLGALSTIARGGRGERLVERPVPRFPWLALLGALLLAYEVGRRHRRFESEPRGAGLPAETPGALPGAAAAIAAVTLILAAPPARGQSAWAKADRAFRQGHWVAAESLYALRAKGGGPPAVQVDLAAARARIGKTAQADSAFEVLARREDLVGQVAAYDHGTSLAERGRYDDALRALKLALQRDPTDDHARWNYEWALRRRRQREANRQQPSEQPQQPQPSQPQSGQPQPQPGSQQLPPAPQQQGDTPPPPRPQQGMDREQAERLLGSLEELERLEQQRLRKVRVMRERRGRDW